MTDSPFNVALVEARIEAGLSVKDAAAKAGFTVGFLRSYEDCAKNPTMKTMWLFARAYGLRVTVDGDGVTIESKEGATLLERWTPTQPGDDNV